MVDLSFLISIILLCFVTCTYTQQCDQSSDVARFDCYQEGNATQDLCEARKCCWREPLQASDVPVPYCYYPSDFPTYAITSNQTTDFGQRIRIVKSQTTFMPHDILDLTVDLIYETQQRFRIRIYDSVNQRYEVPLPVPTVTNKANQTDYEIGVKSNPFSILVTRKSTGAIL
jgi:hypothetical protein